MKVQINQYNRTTTFFPLKFIALSSSSTASVPVPLFLATSTMFKLRFSTNLLSPAISKHCYYLNNLGANSLRARRQVSHS